MEIQFRCSNNRGYYWCWMVFIRWVCCFHSEHLEHAARSRSKYTQLPRARKASKSKEFLLNAKKDVVNTDNELFADHGLHTMADQMTGLEQEQIYLNFWKKHDEEGLKQ